MVDDPIHRFLEEAYVPQVAWLPRPSRVDSSRTRSGFRPKSGGGLVEAYDYATRRGVIAAIDTTGSPLSPQPVIHLETHASYPYLVAHGSDIFCIPQVDSATASGCSVP